MTKNTKSKIATVLFFIAAIAASNHSNNTQTGTLTPMGLMESQKYGSDNIVVINALSSAYYHGIK